MQGYFFLAISLFNCHHSLLATTNEVTGQYMGWQAIGLYVLLDLFVRRDLWSSELVSTDLHLVVLYRKRIDDYRLRIHITA